tara:strand:- start:516 stop:2684 length:2169 start_codon:yes stop_codon:yes gene_type:complete
MTSNNFLLKSAAIALGLIVMLSSVSCADNSASQINQETSRISILKTGSVNGQPERNIDNNLTTEPDNSGAMPKQTTWEFGAGGLIADLNGWNNVQLPQFVTASHIDVSKIATVSKFRSSAGHDFSDSFESCCSMKHYFRPTDYYETRFTQPIYSAVDGIVLYVSEESGGEANAWKEDYVRVTGKQPPSDYRDSNIMIRPDMAPNVWVTHMHVNPIIQISQSVPLSDGRSRMMGIARPASPGYKVKSGDLIGYGLGEIVIKKHLDGPGVPSSCNSSSMRANLPMKLLPGCQAKVSLHSIFEYMTDEVFEQYRAVADVSRKDFIISNDYRTANPLVCDGEDFVERGVVTDPEHFVHLQKEPKTESLGIQSSSTSSDELQSTINHTNLINSYSGIGTKVLGPLPLTTDYFISVTSDKGPIQVSILSESDGERSVYKRPGNTSGRNTYTTPRIESGSIKLSIEADADAAWKIDLLSTGKKDQSVNKTEIARSGNVTEEDSGLPPLNYFQENPSDRFPVDLNENVTQTQPYRGRRIEQAHSGLHVNYSDEDGRWSTIANSNDPTRYPAIYAISDGIVQAIEPLKDVHNPQKHHQSYEIRLSIAELPSGEHLRVSYGIEPFVMEPEPEFYKRFILVKEGQRVLKGETIAYFYVPPGATERSTHLHFHASSNKRILAPTLFDDTVKQEFHSLFGHIGGKDETGRLLDACIGVMLAADENPFEHKESDCL